MFISAETESSDVQAMDVDERIDDISEHSSYDSQPATLSSQMQVDEEMVSAPLSGIGSFTRGITASDVSNPTSNLTSPLNSTSFHHSAFAMKLSTTDESLSSHIGHTPRFPRNPTSTPRPTALTHADLRHLNTLQTTFGARMLANMGWEPGTGLGPTGDGIVTPIQTKLRPKKMGIAFDGFKEKTGTALAKEVRRGEVTTSTGGQIPDKVVEKDRAIWKAPRKVKTKIVYKTYEEIITQAGHPPSPHIPISPTPPTNTPARIPELRYNIHLLTQSSSSNLETLTREARALEERKKWIITEDARLRNAVVEDEERIVRLQNVHEIVNEIGSMSQEISCDGSVPEQFSSLVCKLSDDFPREFEEYKLDEIVVAAIAPVVQQQVSTWDPLSNPTKLIPLFRDLVKSLPVTSPDHTNTAERKMTPFETLLHTTWLPKVRTTLTNSWSPQDPRPALALYESYSPLLPPFIRDNILDQILGKVQLAISEWDPKSKVRLHAIVFPWLPHLGARMDDFLADARVKVRGLLRVWSVGDGIEDALLWKDVFETEWDGLMVKYIVPKLESALHSLIINPHQIQYIKPLQHLLQSALIPPSLISPLLQKHFFPEWLNALHSKLIQPNANFDDIARWYSDWRVFFPEAVGRMDGVNLKRGFEEGLRVMNEAVEVGEDVRMRLRRPRFSSEATLLLNAPSNRNPPNFPKLTHKEIKITFRSIVEDTAAEHNLLIVPTGRAHAVHGHSLPLFRISSSDSEYVTRSGRSGRKVRGLLVYILDDAVWASKFEGGMSGEEGDGGEEFVAIGLDEMVRRVKGGSV